MPPDILTSLNLVDLLLGIIVLFGAWSGWGKGFVVTSLQVLTLAASLLLAFVGYRYAADLLEPLAPGLGPWIAPLSFLAIYIVGHIVFGAVARKIIFAIPRDVHLHAGSRVLGLVPGAVNGLINAVVVALVLLTVPLFDGLSTMARDSALASRLSAPAEWLEAKLAPIFHPAIRRTLQALTIPPESPARIELPFKVADPRVRPELETRMLALVNAERARHGLRPLRADPELAGVARAHSRDMFARGYFSHLSPEGRDAADRIRQANVGFLAAGENLALSQTLASGHQGLMNSPGHRANVLRPQFGRVGIGVLDGGRHGLMITQNFRN